MRKFVGANGDQLHGFPRQPGHFLTLHPPYFSLLVTRLLPFLKEYNFSLHVTRLKMTRLNNYKYADFRLGLFLCTLSQFF